MCIILKSPLFGIGNYRLMCYFYNMFNNFKFSLTTALIVVATITYSCQSIPLQELNKKYTVNQYVSPNRESNINVHDYSLQFISNYDSKKFAIKSVQCNHSDSKIFLLDTKEHIIQDFNKKDTVLLRSSILRRKSNQDADTLTIFYELKGRAKTMIITDFKKIETPINQ